VKAGSVFVGLLRVQPGCHDSFLDWHDDDHRPENHGVIPHLFHSARYIATPESMERRSAAPGTPFAEAGTYLMTYWSTAQPDRLLRDMTIVRERLEALGRCAPIGRDFAAPWRDRLQVVTAYAGPAHHVSPDAVPLVRHDALLILVGRDPGDGGSWARWWDGAGQAGLLADERFVGAFTLRGTEERDLVVHLVFVRGDDASAQDAHAAVLARRPGPPVLYHATYVRQHGGHPRWYE
jgi:hypothetical protein